MKLLVGTIPNLPWWRLKNMTKKEIEEFNRKHMVEIEMSEPTSKELIMMTISEIQKESWNAAIEAAATLAEQEWPLSVSERIRKLKK